MPVCSVLVCRKRSAAISFKTSGVTYHRYPNDPIIKEKWIIATGRKEQSWFPTKSSTICSSHFDKSSFQITKKSRRLFPWAIPTKNLRLVFADDIPIQPKTPNNNGYVEIKVEPVDLNLSNKNDAPEPSSLFNENITIKKEIIEPAQEQEEKNDETQPFCSANITVKTEVLDSDENEINENCDTEMLPAASNDLVVSFEADNTTNQSMYNHMNTNEQNRYLLGVIESKEDMIKFQKRKVKTLQTAVRRYKKKIAAMYQIVNELKKNSLLDVEKLYEDIVMTEEPTDSN